MAPKRAKDEAENRDTHKPNIYSHYTKLIDLCLCTLCIILHVFPRSWHFDEVPHVCAALAMHTKTICNVII